MFSPSQAVGNLTSRQFKVGLIAFALPLSENGPVALATAFVEFAVAVPSHSLPTHHRVFQAAEKAFREVLHLDHSNVRIRESFVCQPVTENPESAREPDQVGDDTRVWLVTSVPSPL